ncbi:MAG: ribosomal protein [Planctomycetota bacterium]
MRHRVFGKQLCVKEDHRRAMLRNLAAGLFEHGQIETTLPKAKAVQPFVEKLITMAKRSGLTSRREVAARINDRAIFRWVVDGEGGDAKKGVHQHWDLPGDDAFEFNRYGELRKAPRLVQHLMTKVAPMYADRAGGYTRIVKLDKRRVGDQTDLCILQLVGKEEGAQVSGRRSNRRRTADKRTKFAADRRKGGAEAVKAE